MIDTNGLLEIANKYSYRPIMKAEFEMIIDAAHEIDRLNAELAQTEQWLDEAQNTCRALGQTAENFAAELAALKEANRWIPVSEDYPEFDAIGADASETVVFITRDGELHLGEQVKYFDGYFWADHDEHEFDNSSVTHWRYIAPPEEAA